MLHYQVFWVMSGPDHRGRAFRPPPGGHRLGAYCRPPGVESPGSSGQMTDALLWRPHRLRGRRRPEVSVILPPQRGQRGKPPVCCIKAASPLPDRPVTTPSKLAGDKVRHVVVAGVHRAPGEIPSVPLVDALLQRGDVRELMLSAPSTGSSPTRAPSAWYVHLLRRAHQTTGFTVCDAVAVGNTPGASITALRRRGHRYHQTLWPSRAF